MPSDVEAAIAAAHNALAHPILLAAAQAEERGECRRECAATHVLEDGRVLEGVVDLAYPGARSRPTPPRSRNGEPTRALLLMV